MIPYGPLYQDGHLSIEDGDMVHKLDLQDCHFGVQVADDGRVWVCVNGMSFLRFKPKLPPIPEHLADAIDSYEPGPHTYE